MTVPRCCKTLTTTFGRKSSMIACQVAQALSSRLESDGSMLKAMPSLQVESTCPV